MSVAARTGLVIDHEVVVRRLVRRMLVVEAAHALRRQRAATLPKH